MSITSGLKRPQIDRTDMRKKSEKWKEALEKDHLSMKTADNWTAWELKMGNSWVDA